LGRCKGEKSCATRCFAEFGSDDLNNWLSCTIEENECVKVPKDVDNSAENSGFGYAIKKLDPSSLVGSWYKTYGLNPDTDLFDCQTNTFDFVPESGKSELDMGVTFRVSDTKGGFWVRAQIHMPFFCFADFMPQYIKNHLYFELLLDFSSGKLCD